MPLQLDDLAALDAPMLEANGQPLMLPVEGIDEDPEQPRREFDANALQDLALPATTPSSRTATAEPGGRGADPQVRVMVPSTTR